MDVLAGRKNVGRIRGQIAVNGEPKDDMKFRQIMGYVEQFDALFRQDTAEEAIEFAAAMKLPNTINKVQRSLWVEQIIEMLEFSAMRDIEVANMTNEQKKRLSIAIELAANPAILFLDGK